MNAPHDRPWPDDGLPVAVVYTDDELRATSANSAWRELAGAEGFFPGLGWTAMFDPGECTMVIAWLQRLSRGSRVGPIEVRGRSTDQWFELRASPADMSVPRARFVVAVVDITSHKRRESQLAFDATHDSLTGLRNRAALLEHAEQALSRLQRSQSLLAVLFLDLDGFKRVNDRYGHDAGDEVLRCVGQKMQAVIRPSDILARVGGDEFVVLCESLSNVQEATTIARRLDGAVRSAVPAHLEDVSLGAAVGVAFADGSGDSPTGMIRRADRAMYLAKHGGRSLDDEEISEARGACIDLRKKDLRLHSFDALVRLAADLDEKWSDATDADGAVEWVAAHHHLRQAIELLDRGRR